MRAASNWSTPTTNWRAASVLRPAHVATRCDAGRVGIIGERTCCCRCAHRGCGTCLAALAAHHQAEPDAADLCAVWAPLARPGVAGPAATTYRDHPGWQSPLRQAVRRARSIEGLCSRRAEARRPARLVRRTVDPSCHLMG